VNTMLPCRAHEERGLQLPVRCRLEPVERDPAAIRSVPRLDIEAAARHGQAVRMGPVSTHEPETRLEVRRARVLVGGIEDEAPAAGRV
jgi:hypothetical protein